MPIYEYKCENGHVFEVSQRMSDERLTECQVCEAPVKRVFHPVPIHFKGAGFYNTDYGTRKRAREMRESKASKTDSKSSDSKGAGETGKEKGKSESSSTAKPSSPSSSSGAD